MIQIVAIIAIILTIAYVLIRHPEKLTIKKMALTAILLSVSLLMTLFSFNTFFLGGQVVIRFSQLVLILLGAALGPIYAVIAGVGFDILNLLIFPLGAPYIGFTLNNIWVGLFAALTFKWLKEKSYKTKLKTLIFTALLYLIYIVIVLTLFITQKNLVQLIDSITFSAIKTVMIFSILIAVIFVGGLIISKYSNLKKISLSQDLMMLMISAILVEFVIQGFFTPIWLYDLAKTPILLSMQIRALKGGLIVFINSFVGIAVYKTILKRLAK